jgi:hypothetical protein
VEPAGEAHRRQREGEADAEVERAREAGQGFGQAPDGEQPAPGENGRGENREACRLPRRGGAGGEGQQDREEEQGGRR